MDSRRYRQRPFDSLLFLGDDLEIGQQRAIRYRPNKLSSSPPAFGRPALDETVGIGRFWVLLISRRHGGRLTLGALEPVQ